MLPASADERQGFAVRGKGEIRNLVVVHFGQQLGFAGFRGKFPERAFGAVFGRVIHPPIVFGPAGLQRVRFLVC